MYLVIECKAIEKEHKRKKLKTQVMSGVNDRQCLGRIPGRWEREETMANKMMMNETVRVMVNKMVHAGP